MTYKFTGRLYRVGDETRYVWGYLSPCLGQQPIPAGSTIMLSDKETGCTNMLKVVPNTKRVCSDRCWAYSHMESQYCQALFGCDNPDKGYLSPVKVVCVDTMLEDL